MLEWRRVPGHTDAYRKRVVAAALHEKLCIGLCIDLFEGKEKAITRALEKTRLLDNLIWQAKYGVWDDDDMRVGVGMVLTDAAMEFHNLKKVP